MFRELSARLYLALRNSVLFRPAVVGRVFEGVAIGVLANTVGYVFDGTLTRGRVLALVLALTLLYVGAALGEEEEESPP